MPSHVPMKESDSGEGASWVVQGAQSVMPHHTTASVHWLGQGDKSNSLCLAATILMKKKKKQASTVTAKCHSTHTANICICLWINRMAHGWGQDPFLFFLLSIHSSPVHLHPLPPLRNQGFYLLPAKPQCLDRPQENEKATSNKHEDRIECRWLRQQKRHKTETHPWKKAPQAKASLTAEPWQRRRCMSPLNTETKKGS